MNDVRLELNKHGDGGFYIFDDNQVVAKMLIGISDNNLNAYHTEAMIEGQGLAKKLLTAMVNYAREHHLKVTPYCPYVHTQFKRRPEEYADIWNMEKERHGQK